MAREIPSIVDIAQAFAEERYDDAGKLCSLRIAVDSTDDASLYYLGQVYFLGEKYDSARFLMDKASALSPDNTSYLEASLNIAYARHDQKKVEEICKRLVKISPAKYRTPYILTMLGDAELGNRRDSCAMAYFREALELDEDFASARLALSDMYFAKGNYPAFFLEMNRIARSPYLEPEGVCECINAFFKKIDNRFFMVWHKQLDELATAPLDVNPADTSCLALAGWWFFSSGRKEQSLEYFKTMDREYPTASSIRSHLMEFYLLSDDYENALGQSVSILSECKLDDHEKMSLLAVAGDCCYRLGRKNQAFVFYEKALGISKDDSTLLNNYAYYLCEEGRSLRKAEKLSRRAVEMEPDNPTLLDTYGWILYKLHRPADAKPYFKRAIIYGGKENSTVLIHYSKVLEALGEKSLSDYYRNLSENKSK